MESNIACFHVNLRTPQANCKQANTRAMKINRINNRSMEGIKFYD